MKKINKVFVIATSIVSIMMCCHDSRADLTNKSSWKLLKKNITGSNPNFAHDSLHRQVDALGADYNRKMNDLHNQYHNQLNEFQGKAGVYGQHNDSLDRYIQKTRDNLTKHEFQKRLQVRGNMHKRNMMAISLKHQEQKAMQDQENFKKLENFKVSLSQDVEKHKASVRDMLGTAASHVTFGH